DVPDVAVEEGHPAGRIERFEHESPARSQLVEGKFEKPQQVGRFEVLDYLRRENPAERSIPERRQVSNGIGLAHVEAPGPAHLHHFVIQIDAARSNSARGQQVEKLTSPTPYVEHVAPAFEKRQVGLQALTNDLAGTTEAVFKADVLVRVDGGRK